MVAKEPLNERIAEFEDHLWDHTTDPFQLDFDERLPLAEHEVAVLTEIIRMICGNDSDDAIADILRARTPASSWASMSSASSSRSGRSL